LYFESRVLVGKILPQNQMQQMHVVYHRQQWHYWVVMQYYYRMISDQGWMMTHPDGCCHVEQLHLQWDHLHRYDDIPAHTWIAPTSADPYGWLHSICL
jgi:hypothetical protein